MEADGCKVGLPHLIPYLQAGNTLYKICRYFFKYDRREHYYDLPGIGDNTIYRQVGCVQKHFSH